MMPLQVRIFDDRQNVEQWTRELRRVLDPDRYEVHAVPKATFEEAIQALVEHRKAMLDDSARSGQDTIFDDTDVLIVDYDLTYLESGAFLTGEHVAYLARCFSRCGLIVAVNQYRSGFDLSLAAHSESFADLSIQERHLSNLGLWDGNKSGFRPWSWPILSDAVDQYHQCVQELRGRLEMPILAFLGLEHVMNSIPRPVLQYLECGNSADKTTFVQFVHSSDYGIRMPQEVVEQSEDQVCRIAAARIAGWTRQQLLPLQDVLIDAPHLAARIPSLMAGRPASDWYALTDPTLGGNHPALEVLRDARFDGDNWTGVPTWDWPAATELVVDFDSDFEDLVFCEDLSAFVPRTVARAFVAELATPYRRRYVVDQDGKAGQAFLDRQDWANDPRESDYRPAIRYSL